jgi:hypothetical protein
MEGHPCRWDAATSELVCDELGVAYPVRNGMPNLRPAGDSPPVKKLAKLKHAVEGLNQV